MPADRFVEALTAQIGREFGASQQYLAVAVWYEGQTFPRLASLFYAQALEERDHALMMVKYLLDSGLEPKLPGVAEPKSSFADVVEPISVALEQERRVTDQISELASVAREENDYVSEQFVQWFLKEQVEEIDLFSSLLDVAERSRERPMDIEEYLAREGGAGGGGDPTAPPVAGASS
ncbi:MAG TPA: ferritin [Thermoleophilaceae bacterium]|jgi:ferritin